MIKTGWLRIKLLDLILDYVYTAMTPGNFARTTNNGATWTTTNTFGTQSLPGIMICVGPDGATDGGVVYVVTNSGSAFASTYTFYASTNGGVNFTFEIFSELFRICWFKCKW